MKFLVVEVMHWPSGAVSTNDYAYDNENSANGKYHQILSQAATSAMLVHSAVMFTEEGFFLKGECFKHEPEPEPEPEPTEGE